MKESAREAFIGIKEFLKDNWIWLSMACMQSAAVYTVIRHVYDHSWFSWFLGTCHCFGFGVLLGKITHNQQEIRWLRRELHSLRWQLID